MAVSMMIYLMIPIQYGGDLVRVKKSDLFTILTESTFKDVA